MYYIVTDECPHIRCAVAAVTILLLDLLLTFDEEVARVWKAGNSFGKYLFLFNRYVPFVLFGIDLNYQLNPSLGPRESSLSEPLNTVTCSTQTGFMPNYKLAYHLVVPNEVPGVMVGCTPQCTAPICRRMLTAFWIPFFVTETSIFGLTVYKALRNSSGFVYSTAFVKVLYRDGFIYYIGKLMSFSHHVVLPVKTAISVCNLLIWILAPISLVLMRCLQIVVCSRLLLNIRGMLEPKGTTTDYEMSALAFNVRGSKPDTLDTVLSGN
ncbi:hypothetical protein OE88DRAFT_1648965 [Heliocybe sulcata]|uniref:DUF6533 domain-containing protein n=1 Tax=Heliocybe sulcata TaxID=5364 RepID=A0A5C3MKY8_9AGAM|nr:hypothetical protein OE88DRAFT_1648965 [Heliocybe sulcata]